MGACGARRSDQYQWTQKAGDPLAEEGNDTLKRTIALGFRATERGKFFSMENPKNSYAWLIKIMEQPRKYMRTELVCLDQCPYGAETVKPTGILATAP